MVTAALTIPPLPRPALIVLVGVLLLGLAVLMLLLVGRAKFRAAARVVEDARRDVWDTAELDEPLENRRGNRVRDVLSQVPLSPEVTYQRPLHPLAVPQVPPVIGRRLELHGCTDDLGFWLPAETRPEEPRLVPGEEPALPYDPDDTSHFRRIGHPESEA